MKMRKRIPALCLCLILLAGCFSAMAGESNGNTEPAQPDFADVREGDWFREAVLKLAGEGIIHGFDDGLFHPGEPLTKAQLIKMLFAEEVPEPPVGADWWEPYFALALEAGVLTAEDWESMTLPLDRGETALLLYRRGLWSPAEGQEGLYDPAEIAGSIADYESLPEHCAEAVLAAYAAGVLEGYDDGCFHAENQLSRAEAAQLLLRFREAEYRTWKCSFPTEETELRDCLLLGNSLAGGLYQTGALTSPDLLFRSGGSIFTFDTDLYLDACGRQWLLSEGLSEAKYRKIIVVYGTNEMGYEIEGVRTHLRRLMEFLVSCQGQAEFFLCTAPPIYEPYGGTEYFSNARCAAVNEEIRTLAEEWDMRLIDAWALMADGQGSLPEDMTWDGIHLKPESYALWGELIRSEAEIE